MRHAGQYMYVMNVPFTLKCTVYIIVSISVLVCVGLFVRHG